MLYPKNKEKVLSKELFKNPTSEYRGTPFWAWNTKLTKELLGEQIEQLKTMGFGGFHMHPRTGMETPYLSEEFIELIKYCVDKAKQEKMLAWLYDEDRWPSGFAGGIVTKEKAYRARYLLFTKQPYREGENYTNDGDSASRGSRTGKGVLLSCYDIQLDEKGYLQDYKVIGKEDKEQGDKWYAYLEIASESSWFNNQTYVDTLNEKAMKKFIEVTYEAYKNNISEEFGKVVPAIFTDEPQFTHKTTLNFAHEDRDIIIPWTDDLPKTYKEAYNENLIEKLPEVFWELPEQRISVTRYRYHDHIAERFAKSFADQCGKWCEKEGLMLTGHMMEEPTLGSQTAALGEAMRSYRSFGLPGIDMLCDGREYTTAKQAQSAAHQFGKEGVLSELYGVTNWDFDFRGHKLQGDWQAALGITVRVPHLTWVSMEGEAKRDYPASIGYQSPWYQEYPLVEDHFARLNTVLTRGVPKVRVGVIHPIESYWLHFGPREQTEMIRQYKEEKFRDITEWLLFGGIDFDFIAESLLPIQCGKGSTPLEVGKMAYDVIIVPECETLRKTTYERLRGFGASGGRLIFLGESPKYMDALPSELVKELYKQSEKVAYNRKDILEALEKEREITLFNDAGSYTNHLLYQMREEENHKWLFICQGRLPQNQDIPYEEEITIKIQGTFNPTLYDTLTGETSVIQARYDGKNTWIKHKFYAHDSLLLKLEPGEGIDLECNAKQRSEKVIEIENQVAVLLEEPNVYLLDVAEYKLDDESYEKEEEILRLDNKCREKLGYPMRGGQVAQPWVLEKEEIKHKVTLKFNIKSEVEVEGTQLATEKLQDAQVVVNGEEVEKSKIGWFVDKSIQTVCLPKLHKGVNVIEITYPFGQTTHLEWCYLLGDFGVEVRGREKVVISQIEKLAFGEVTHQGLPFYGGNISYKFKVDTQSDTLKVQVLQYRGAVIGVKLDGVEVGKIAFAPYQVVIDKVTPGEHEIELKLFGNRVNTFGPVHNCDTGTRWFGPDAWRSTGYRWCYEYRLKAVGILIAPYLIEEIKED